MHKISDRKRTALKKQQGSHLFEENDFSLWHTIL